MDYSEQYLQVHRKIITLQNQGKVVEEIEDFISASDISEDEKSKLLLQLDEQMITMEQSKVKGQEGLMKIGILLVITIGLFITASILYVKTDNTQLFKFSTVILIVLVLRAIETLLWKKE